MSFVKLDCGLLDSTLWIDRVARELFITALLMAEPHELKIPMKQFNARDLNETGFVVPEGWYGFVPAAGTGIIHRAGVSQEEGLKALERLGAEDPESRSPEFGGRRLIRIDGGYIVLNFVKYRDKDSTTSERSRRWRERQKLKALTTRVTVTPSPVIRHQAEAEAEVNKTEEAADAALTMTGKKTHKQPSKFVWMWSVAYREFFGKEYMVTPGKDEKASDRLTGLRDVTSEDLISIAKKAWAMPDGFNTGQAVSISGFASRFNEIRKDVGSLKGAIKKRPSMEEYEAAERASLKAGGQ